MYIDDDTRLRHIRDATHEAIEISRGRTRADLDSDFMVRRALYSCIAEIGEAATKLTDGARSGLPCVPWGDIINMRDQLVNDYDRVDPPAVEKTLAERLPPLLVTLERRLGPPYSAAEIARPIGVGPAQLATNREQIIAFCQRHPITRLSLFGSVLRDDFHAGSDVDMLVEFEPGAPIGMFEMVRLNDELTAIVGREVDLRTPGDLSDYIRQRVMDSAEQLFPED